MRAHDRRVRAACVAFPPFRLRPGALACFERPEARVYQPRERACTAREVVFTALDGARWVTVVTIPLRQA